MDVAVAARGRAAITVVAALVAVVAAILLIR